MSLNHVKCDLTVVKVVYGESMTACVHSVAQPLKSLDEKTKLVDQETFHLRGWSLGLSTASRRLLLGVSSQLSSLGCG